MDQRLKIAFIALTYVQPSQKMRLVRESLLDSAKPDCDWLVPPFMQTAEHLGMEVRPKECFEIHACIITRA